MANKLINIGNFRTSGDAQRDIEEFIKLVSKLEDWVASNIPERGVSGTFTSADIPGKTIVVANGIVVEIK